MLVILKIFYSNFNSITNCSKEWNKGHKAWDTGILIACWLSEAVMSEVHMSSICMIWEIAVPYCIGNPFASN